MIQFIPNLLSGNIEKLPERFFGALVLGLIPLAFWIYPGFLGKQAHLLRSGIQFYVGFLSLSALIMSLTYFRQIRSISDTPISQIRSAAQGFVKLEGTQSPGPNGTLSSPFSHQPCTWYQAITEQYVQQGSDAYWTIIHETVSQTPFYLDDQHDRCTIYPVGAKVLQAHQRCWYGATEAPSTSPPPKWLSPFQKGRFRYTECYLSPNTPLTVMGQFKSQQQEGQTTHQLSKEGLVKHQPFLFFSGTQNQLLNRFRLKVLVYGLLFISLGGFFFKFRLIHQSYWSSITSFLSL